MPALKRSRQSLHEDEESEEEEEEEVLETESARSELRQDNVNPLTSLLGLYTDTQSAKKAETLDRT